MKNILSTSKVLLIGAVFALSIQNYAIAQDTSKLVDSIKSVAQVKKELKETFENLDQCSSGSCFNSASTYVCELVGALDVKMNGRIIGQMSGGKSVTFCRVGRRHCCLLPPSEPDLRVSRYPAQASHYGYVVP